MAGIRSGGIKYALGKQTAIGTRAIDEGLPLLDHLTPLPVTDSLKGANTTRADYGRDVDYHIPGTIYYTARARIPFSPAWACRLLDLYFENTAIGASPNYARIYSPADIPDDPSEWLSAWKYTAKTGYDENMVGVGGVIYGMTFEGQENGVITLSADIAFASREDAVATGTPSDWDINESTGRYAPLQNSSTIVYIGGNVRAPVSWRITISHIFRPHFYASQNPNRISRSGLQIDGQIVFRDKDGILAAFEDGLKDSAEILFAAINGTTTFLLNTKIHGPETREERGTRYGYYNFTGLANDGLSPASPLTIYLSPQIAGL